jgi:HlyD family secretion protein
MKRLLVAIAIVAVLALVLWGSLRGGGGHGVAVEVLKVGRRTVVAKVKATGEINPKSKVEIQSKIIGEITAIPVKEGDSVKAGQVVLEIEKDLYVAARDQAKAALDQATVNLERAQAELANAELSFKRISQLRAEGVVAEEALDQARLARDTAAVGVRAQAEAIRQARSAYQRALDDLDRTTILSPIDGTVTALNVEKGETAIMGTMNFQGSVLMVIGDLSEMLAEVEVAESEVVGLKLGQKAAITVDALPDTPMAGQVVEIASSGEKQGDVVKFKVKIALDKPDPRVRPGMTARVEITTATAENVFAVQQQAVQTRWLDEKGKEVSRKEGDDTQREVTAVYVFEDGKARRREVTTGVHDELWVEVTKGVDEGAEVIVGPYRTLRNLKNGDDVHVEKKDVAKASA